MTNYPYTLFNKSPLELRLIGARGGRTFGRNHRRRRALAAVPPLPVPSRVPPPQPNTAEAIALLDARFPWLRGAELRTRVTPRSAARVPVK